MPLLTSPSTITDGTTPIIFTYQNQVQIGKAIVSTYKELAAAASRCLRSKVSMMSAIPH
jgi:hypothetical protein